MSRNPPRLKHLKTKDFILPFEFKKKGENKTPMSEETAAAAKEQKVATSKGFWFGLVHKPKEPPPRKKK